MWAVIVSVTDSFCNHNFVLFSCFPSSQLPTSQANQSCFVTSRKIKTSRLLFRLLLNTLARLPAYRRRRDCSARRRWWPSSRRVRWHLTAGRSGLWTARSRSVRTRSTRPSSGCCWREDNHHHKCFNGQGKKLTFSVNAAPPTTTTTTHPCVWVIYYICTATWRTRHKQTSDGNLKP